MEEKNVFHINGYLGLILVLVVLAGGVYLSVAGVPVLGGLLVIIAVLGASSLTIISPNQSKVLTFFGRYIGTIREAGLYLTVPLTNKSTVSLRVRNFNSEILKVNDLQGNPVEIAAVIVLRWSIPAKPCFRWKTTNNSWKFKVNRPSATWLLSTPMIILAMARN